MMNLRNTLATSAAAVALMAGSSAQAGDYYVSLFGGLSTFDDEIPFQASTSNSAFLGSVVSSTGVTIKSGAVGAPYNPFYLKTYLAYVTGFTPTSSAPLLTYVPFTTTRDFLSYKVTANVVNKYSQAQSSNFQWDDDFDSGWVVGAAFGAQIAEGWRSELEVAYRHADVSGGGRVQRRINGNQYQQVSFTSVKNNLIAAYNGGNGGFFTTSGFASGTNLVVPTTSGVTIGGTLTGLPVSNGSATTYVTIKTTALGTIPYLAFTFPNAGTTVGNFTSSGDVQVWSLMANLWYDFNFMGLNPDGFHTFVGGGLGVANLDLEYEAAAGTYFGGTIGYDLDDSAMGFAYQLGGGVGMELGGGMMLSAQYRWFGTSDVDLGNTDMRVESHNAIIGLQIPLGNLSM